MSDDNRGWNRDSEVDAETNPGVHRADSNGGQGKNCDSLFHNIHLSTQFDAAVDQNIVATELPFCKQTTSDLPNVRNVRAGVDEMPDLG